MERYIIQQDATIFEALRRLEKLSSDTLTLFIVDEHKVMKGTLTDGDIRRGLLKGLTLQAPVTEIMNAGFAFLKDGEIDLRQLGKYKEKFLQLIPVLDQDNKITRIINLRNKKSFLQLDAVLMAGGRGERLRPLTDTIPKPLLKVGDKSIINYNLDNLIQYGIDNLYVTVHYLAEQIIEHVKNYHEDAVIKCITEEAPLGTFGAVKKIKSFQNDYILVMNADLFTNIDCEDFFIAFLESGADMAIATIPYTVNVPYALLDIADDIVTGFKEKPSLTHYANAGIYIIKKELVHKIPDSFFNATDFIQMLIDSGHKIIKYPIAGYWVDIGRPEDFKMVQELASHIKA